MERRTLLSTIGAGLAVAVAGCTESGSGGGEGDGTGNDSTSATSETTASNVETTTTPSTETTEEPTETPEPDTPAETTTGAETEGEATTVSSPPEVADTSMDVTSENCGGKAQTADVSVDGDTVTVEGLIRGRNGCHTARLARTTVEDGTLTLRVVSYVPESELGNACQQCLLDIEYTATVTMAEDTPTRVVVEHGDEQVAKTTPN